MVTYNRNKHITIGTFDLIRGIGILVVVFQHTFNHIESNESYIFRFLGATWLLCSGLMPMYFLISGYSFKPKSIVVMLKKTCISLLIPYFCVMLGYLILYPILYVDVAFGGSVSAVMRMTLRYAVAFLLGSAVYETPVFGFVTTWNVAAWFLMAMFVALNVLNLVLRLKQPKVRFLAAAACPVIGYILFRCRFSFFCVPQGLVGVGYCYVGYLLKKYNLLEKLSSRLWVYLILVPVFIFERYCGDFDLSQMTFKCMPLDYIGAGLSGLLMVLVGVKVGNLEWRGLDWLKKIGMYTYWIFAIHAIEMEALPWWHWQRPLADRQLLAFVLEMIAKAIIYVLGCMLIKYITKQRYLKKAVRHQAA